MKRLFNPAMLAAIAAVLVWLPITSRAQQGGGGGGGGGGRGNFDPEQMRQRMMERYREALEVKDDEAWKAIETRITKVNEARRDVGFGGMRGMFGAGRRPGGGAGGAEASSSDSERRPRGGGFGGQQSAAAQDLQKAIDSKASAETIKAKLVAYREDKQQKQANLEKAQEDLKKVLTLRQEAAAVLAGLLD